MSFVRKLSAARHTSLKEGEGDIGQSHPDSAEAITQLNIEAAPLYEDREKLALQFPSLSKKCFNLLKHCDKA